MRSSSQAGTPQMGRNHPERHTSNGRRLSTRAEVVAALQVPQATISMRTKLIDRVGDTFRDSVQD